MRFLMTVLKIGIALAIINGTVRAGAVYWNFYQFEDAAQELALFGWQSTPEKLQSATFALASELEIPIAEDQISVTRDGGKTLITAAYEHPVEYFPNRTYPLKLAFSVEGRNLMSTAVK
jgi:hypothetical protein